MPRNKRIWLMVSTASILVVGVIAIGITIHRVSSPSPTPSPGRGPQIRNHTLVDESGTGAKQTAAFTPSGTWELDWSYDCSNVQNQNQFGLSVWVGHGAPFLGLPPISQTDPKGRGTQYLHRTTDAYLKIDSPCQWHVTAKG
jgi:hypothetical protein